MHVAGGHLQLGLGHHLAKRFEPLDGVDVGDQAADEHDPPRARGRRSGAAAWPRRPSAGRSPRCRASRRRRRRRARTSGIFTFSSVARVRALTSEIITASPSTSPWSPTAATSSLPSSLARPRGDHQLVAELAGAEIRAADDLRVELAVQVRQHEPQDIAPPQHQPAGEDVGAVAQLVDGASRRACASFR